MIIELKEPSCPLNSNRINFYKKLNNLFSRTNLVQTISHWLIVRILKNLKFDTSDSLYLQPHAE